MSRLEGKKSNKHVLSKRPTSKRSKRALSSCVRSRAEQKRPWTRNYQRPFHVWNMQQLCLHCAGGNNTPEAPPRAPPPIFGLLATSIAPRDQFCSNARTPRARPSKRAAKCAEPRDWRLSCTTIVNEDPVYSQRFWVYLKAGSWDLKRLSRASRT